MRRAMGIGLAMMSLAAAAPPGTPQPRLDLSAPFGLPRGWQLVTRQGPEEEDPGGNRAPGALHLCITRDGGRTCRPALDTMLVTGDGKNVFDTVHYLEFARVIRPAPDRPLLWVQVASLHAGNGDQIVGRMALAYDRAGQRFVPVYAKRTGRNNNQDVRFIEKGALRGAIISAEPTTDAPFAFWITVNRIGRDGRYAPILRYRSATRYGDGNPLAVIDSDMPETLRRLNLWRPADPLPLPDGPCPQPRLIARVLWCTPPKR